MPQLAREKVLTCFNHQLHINRILSQFCRSAFLVQLTPNNRSSEIWQ